MSKVIPWPGACRMVWVAVLFFRVGLAAEAARDGRPNILFVFADDWGRHASIYAKLEGAGSPNDVIATPNFDRIAGEGVLFRNAFVSAPSCTPCRSALLSGQHFWRTGRGAILMGAAWDDRIPSFPLLLRDAGYHIGQSLKVWGPGKPTDGPYGGTRYEYEAAGVQYRQFSLNVTRMMAQGRRQEEAKQVLYDEVMANFESFLRDRRPGQPFCYWFGPSNMHRKWVRGSGKALWGLDPDRLVGLMPAYLPDVPEVREDLADYFGEIMAFDVALGLMVDRLQALGELDNTVIVISGDHGAPGFLRGKCNLYDFGTRVPLAIRWGGGSHGVVIDDLVSLPDVAPTLLELAGVDIPPIMTGRSLVDHLRTKESGWLKPDWDAVFIGRERHVENAREGYLPYPQRAIRTKDHLFIINFEPTRWPMGEPYRLDGDKVPSWQELTENTRATLADEDAGPTKAWMVTHRNDDRWRAYYERAYGKRPRVELYDLASDPHQIRNVAEQPSYAGIRAQLEKQLLDELRRTGDPQVTGDGRYFEEPPLAGPLEGARPGVNLSPAELRRGR